MLRIVLRLFCAVFCAAFFVGRRQVSRARGRDRLPAQTIARRGGMHAKDKFCEICSWMGRFPDLLQHYPLVLD